MIEHIKTIVDRVINNAKLAQAEKVVLDKYESLINPPKAEEKPTEPTKQV